MELTQNQITQLINNFAKQRQLKLIKSTNKTHYFITKDNKKIHYTTDTIYKYMEYTKSKNTSLNLNIKIEKNTKPHEKIKIISFGINESEYKQLKEIAQKNNLTLNNLLKQITKQVIKQNI